MGSRARFRTFGRYHSVFSSLHFTGAEGVQFVRRTADIFRTLAKIQANHIAFFLNRKPCGTCFLRQLAAICQLRFQCAPQRISSMIVPPQIQVFTLSRIPEARTLYLQKGGSTDEET